jgi:hypothetical protein
MFVYWELRQETLEHVRAARPGGCASLRLLVIEPTWDGPRTATRDHDVSMPLGDSFVRDLPRGSVVRAAVGWRIGDVFVPLAHSAALESPPGQPSGVLGESLVRWTPSGAKPVTSSDPDAMSIERALGMARARIRGRVPSPPAVAPPPK